jgi:hypothetical protein
MIGYNYSSNFGGKMILRHKLKKKKYIKKFKLKKKMPNSIINLISLLGVGKHNAVSARYIQSAFAFDDNEVTSKRARELVREAIIDYGIPIGSNTRGYFIIKNYNELNENISMLLAHNKSITERVNALKINFFKYYYGI